MCHSYGIGKTFPIDLVLNGSSNLSLKQLFLIVHRICIQFFMVFVAPGASGKNRPFIDTSGKLGNASVKNNRTPIL